ncbi:hypothetical protein J6590_018214 [Homalodisca vitripennis]|nr:hypothetical protein J6590_018214 [Homalodisca vitripennis]
MQRTQLLIPLPTTRKPTLLAVCITSLEKFNSGGGIEKLQRVPGPPDKDPGRDSCTISRPPLYNDTIALYINTPFGVVCRTRKF